MSKMKLEEMDFFDLKLLADKEGTLYVRDNNVFIYQGANKIEIDNNHPGVVDPFGLEKIIKDNTPLSKPDAFMIGDKIINKLVTTKNTKENGYFWFWQHEEYFVLCFVSETNKSDKGTVYLLRAGNGLKEIK